MELGFYHGSKVSQIKSSNSNLKREEKSLNINFLITKFAECLQHILEYIQSNLIKILQGDNGLQNLFKSNLSS
jgi:hypothetical protein